MASAAVPRFSFIFHAPAAAVDACKAAIFEAGAGRYPGPGSYTECCWSIKGTGQFRPGATANPNIGSVGALEHVEARRDNLHWRGCRATCSSCVEGVSVHVKDPSLDTTLPTHTLDRTHPYEEPSFKVIRLEDF